MSLSDVGWVKTEIDGAVSAGVSRSCGVAADHDVHVSVVDSPPARRTRRRRTVFGGRHPRVVVVGRPRRAGGGHRRSGRGRPPTGAAAGPGRGEGRLLVRPGQRPAGAVPPSGTRRGLPAGQGRRRAEPRAARQRAQPHQTAAAPAAPGSSAGAEHRRRAAVVGGNDLVVDAALSSHVITRCADVCRRVQQSLNNADVKYVHCLLPRLATESKNVSKLRQA